MRRRTFLTALAASATPLLAACNADHHAPAAMQTLPSPAYAQSDRWSPLSTADFDFALEGTQRIDARDAQGNVRWSYGSSVQELNGATDIVWHQDAVTVVDSGNRRILRLDANGQPMETWTDARFERLHSAVSLGATLLVTDTLQHCVWAIDSSGNSSRAFGVLGGAEGELNGPRGIAVLSTGELIVVDGGNRRLVVHAPSGAFVSEFSHAEMEAPRHLVVDRDGIVHVSDAVRGRVWAFSSNGRLTNEHVPAHPTSTTPVIRGVALDRRGDVVVSVAA